MTFWRTTLFGADTVLLSSASSKTALGTAHALRQRPDIHIVGLTSAHNVAFCQSLGCYSQVLSYEQLQQLPTAAFACMWTLLAMQRCAGRCIRT